MNFQSVTHTLIHSMRKGVERVNDPGGPQVPVYTATYGYRRNNVTKLIYLACYFKKNTFV